MTTSSDSSKSGETPLAEAQIATGNLASIIFHLEWDFIISAEKAAENNIWLSMEMAMYFIVSARQICLFVLSISYLSNIYESRAEFYSRRSVYRECVCVCKNKVNAIKTFLSVFCLLMIAVRIFDYVNYLYCAGTILRRHLINKMIGESSRKNNVNTFDSENQPIPKTKQRLSCTGKENG